VPKHVIEAALTKAAVGLGNVDNTSDANKPVSSATQTALNGKSNTGHGHTFSEITGTLSTAQLPPLAINETFAPADQAAMLALTAQRGDIAIRVDNGKTYVLASDSPGTLADWKQITAAGDVVSVAGRTGAVVLAKADVGLGNVDNTADTAKPVSTAQQTALNGKENTITAGTTAQVWRGDKAWVTADKALVGLANVDNTSDVNKPVSTAQQTALNLKANLAGPTFTGTVTLPSTTNGLSKTNVGLGNVDNTADSAKPVSTAQQTALDAKANLVGTADVEITDATKGVILKAPGGLRWRLTVGDDGAITTTTVP
jgi:hypothetical protein